MTVEIRSEHDLGEDTEDRVRRAVAILLDERQGEREGEDAA